MDVEAWCQSLAELVRYQPEAALLQELQQLVQDHGDAPVALQDHTRELLTRRADAFRSWPWPLPDSLLVELSRLGGNWDWRRACTALLAHGIGRSQLGAEPGVGCWVPEWLMLEAARRTPHLPPVLPHRWAIPTGWPVPTRQWLIAGLDQMPALRAEMLPWIPMRPQAVIAGPLYPAAWRAHRATGALSLRGLARLAARDPYAGVRRLLGSGLSPLQGISELLAGLIWQSWCRAEAAGVPWEGVFAGTGRWQVRVERVTRCRPDSATAEDPAVLQELVITPGWLWACLEAVGFAGAGTPPEVLALAEADLIAQADPGGMERGSRERWLAPPRVRRWPAAGAALILALPVHWPGDPIPALGLRAKAMLARPPGCP